MKPPENQFLMQLVASSTQCSCLHGLVLLCTRMRRCSDILLGKGVWTQMFVTVERGNGCPLPSPPLPIVERGLPRFLWAFLCLFYSKFNKIITTLRHGTETYVSSERTDVEPRQINWSDLTVWLSSTPTPPKAERMAVKGLSIQLSRSYQKI
jgi:hypothetical protein